MAGPENHLYYGDNLTILRDRDRIPTESIDLIYLDPPFNSNATYNVLFKSHEGANSTAQIQAFDDTWHWNQQTEKLFLSMIGGGCPPRVAEALTGMRNLLGTSDMNAYLVMMAARLVELHRVLKPTGSLYLHCDPTASHYLKIMLDAVFGPERFLNEVIWKRTHSHGGAKRYGPVHDVLLFYTQSAAHTWNRVKTPYSDDYVERFFRFEDVDGRKYRSTILTGSGTRNGDSGKPWGGYDPTARGRHWAIPGYVRPLLGSSPPPATVQEALDRLDAIGRVLRPNKKNGVPSFKQYLDDMEGVDVQDIWTDIPPIGAHAAERLGYPTQKPLALLERIITASSSEGDVVLDPFCGCGTTIDAAQKLRRHWIGIDVTYLAIDLIGKRLEAAYPGEIEGTYMVHGVPADLDGARALFEENPFDFERWAVSLIDGQPNQKQVGDRGIDGRVRFHADETRIGQALVSVKGGKTVNPGMVRDLVGTVQRENAEIGILVTLTEPTRGMLEEARKSGSYTVALTGQEYPRIQVMTVAQVMAGAKPKMPTAILPYVRAKARGVSEQLAIE